MTDGFARNRADSMVDWVASLLFAALVGYACLTVGGTRWAACGAVGGFAVAFALMARIPSERPAMAAFAPQVFDDATAEPDELLLDDPLMAPAAGSRVVKLFTPAESSPGVLVARIEDYLGRDPDRAVQGEPGREAPRPQPDASAALHAALSNIRASLR